MDRIFVIGRDEVPAKVNLGEGEELRWTFVVLPGTSCSLSVQINLDGRGASADVAGLYLCNASEDVRIDVLMKHNIGGCTSRQLFKGIAGGASRVEFDGLVYVARDALRTSARQENHSILLSEGAKVSSKPQLEIYADDVECSHGATTGYLNPDELFYMRSRGIPEQEARRLQIISFVAPVASLLPETLQKEVYESLY